MSSLPAPYDITPIPLFPYIPAAWWWLVLLAAAVIIVFLLSRSPKGAQRRAESAFNAAQEELRRLLQSPLQPRDLLARASLVSRRFLTLITGSNLRSATPAEMAGAAGSAPAWLEPIFAVTTRLESFRFAPTLDPDRAASLCGELLDALSRVQESYRQPEAPK